MSDFESQNVHITGTSLPGWATDVTQQSILSSAKLQNRQLGNIANIMAKLTAVMAGDKSAAIGLKTLIEEERKSRRQAESQAKSNDADKVRTDNNTKKQSDRVNEDAKKSQSVMTSLLKAIFGMNTDVTKNLKQSTQLSKQQLTVLKELKEKGFSEKAARTMIGSGGDSDGVIGSTGNKIIDAAKIVAEVGTALYTISSAGSEFLQQNMADRFELASEIKQSGLFKELQGTSNSFAGVTSTINQNNMTMKEGIEYMRMFSKSVGITGAAEAMDFLDAMRKNTDILTKFGMTAGQLNKLSGIYMDTLAETAMLTTLTRNQREQGMKNFVDIVSETSQVLKISMEDSAKLIHDYLVSPDVAGRLITNENLTQEQQLMIGQMANMGGDFGKTIASYMMNPEMFYLSPEGQAMYENPAMLQFLPYIQQIAEGGLSGQDPMKMLQDILPQMVNEIQQNPLYDLYGATDSSSRQFFASVATLNQTIKDGDFIPPQTVEDKRHTEMLEAIRTLSVKPEEFMSRTLDVMEKNGQMIDVLNRQNDLIQQQIVVADTLIRDGAGPAATMFSAASIFSTAVDSFATSVAQFGANLLPNAEDAARPSDVAEAAVAEEKSANQQEIDKIIQSMSDNNAEGVDELKSAILGGKGQSAIEEFKASNPQYDQGEIDKLAALIGTKQEIEQTADDIMYNILDVRSMGIASDWMSLRQTMTQLKPGLGEYQDTEGKFLQPGTQEYAQRYQPEITEATVNVLGYQMDTLFDRMLDDKVFSVAEGNAVEQVLETIGRGAESESPEDKRAFYEALVNKVNEIKTNKPNNVSDESINRLVNTLNSLITEFR